METEGYSELQNELVAAKAEYESERKNPSDETGQRMVATAITLAGVRVAFQIARLNVSVKR